MSELPITVPNSLFSKMMMTICETFGTSGIGMDVGAVVEAGAVVALGMVSGGRVGGGTVGADSICTGWQAEARKDAMIIIHKICRYFFMMRL